MNQTRGVEELEVFKKAHNVTLEIYEITGDFPQEEKYGLISQMRRASLSIASNLMEGSHRLNRKEFRQFAEIARGSVGELKYQLLLAKDLNYISTRKYDKCREETEGISKMLYALARSLEKS